jgi:preprotein translocase subunit YajC
VPRGNIPNRAIKSGGPGAERLDKEGELGGSLPLIVLYAVGFIAIFYFMAIRPQQRQRRAHEDLVSSIKPGDEVITAGGMFGTVKRTEDTVITLTIAKNVDIKVARKAVAEVISEARGSQNAGKTGKPVTEEAAALLAAKSGAEETGEDEQEPKA